MIQFNELNEHSFESNTSKFSSNINIYVNTKVAKRKCYCARGCDCVAHFSHDFGQLELSVKEHVVLFYT